MLSDEASGQGRMAKKQKPNGSGANLGFEEKLWAAADKLRGHMDAAEYRQIVLRLVFVRSAKLEKAILRNRPSLGFMGKESS